MSIINETAKLLVKTGFCRFFTTSKHGVRIRFSPTRISKRLWVENHRFSTKKSKYHDMEQFFLGYLRPGDRVVDIGANIGWYTLLAAKTVGPTGEVFAFEAHPNTFDYLIRNIAENELYNIRLFETALGDREGEVLFSDESEDDMNKVVDKHGLAVHMNRLDEFPLIDLEGVAHIELMKIDVEGFELFVLRGAPRILEHTQTILIEVWDSHMTSNGYTFVELFNLLTSAGFHLLHQSEGRFEPVTVDYDSSQFADLVATRDVERFKARM